MRAIKIHLRSGSFWSIPPLYLNEENTVSPIVNVDLLNEKQISIINEASRAGDIYIKTLDGQILSGINHELVIDSSYNISVEDIEVQECVMPDIISITESEVIDDDEEVKAQQEREGMLKEAEVLLGRNGNVIKNIINAMDKTDYNYKLLNICVDTETKKKNRAGVINSIHKWLSE